MKKTSNIFFWIVSRLLVWRIILLIVAFYAIQTIAFKESFPYWETLLEPEGSPIIWSWGNFDGVHYITIAEKGYSAQYTQAFFPLYPLVIRYLSKVPLSYLIAGLSISHIALPIALFLFYKLVRFDYSAASAKRSLIYLMLFPTSFFLGSLYSESLFLALIFGSLYAARQKKWWIAGILGAFASATRFFGIFLLPALLIEWYYGKDRTKEYSIGKLIKTVFPITLSALGLVLYMLYLNKAFSDPLLFLHSQPYFGAERTGGKLILLYQVFWRYTKMLLTVDIHSLVYYTVFLEALSGLLFLLLTLIAFKRIRISYAIFGFLAYITPTLTGTLSSMPRYVLILFPCFILLGRIRNFRFQRIWWILSAILLGINTALFIRGYWIA
jgi:hypothetical protein